MDKDSRYNELYSENRTDLTQKELDKILDSHKRWLESDGKDGNRANLAKKILQGLDLCKADLRRAILVGVNLDKAQLIRANLTDAQILPSDVDTEDERPASFKSANLNSCILENANLLKADFSNAILYNANMIGTHLESANFQNADLTETNFFEANLKDANLETAKGLSTESLAGSDVTHAYLPEEIKHFDGLKIIDDSSKNARKLFIAMIIGCIYSCLTIATTKDASLFTNSATSPLPIIGTGIPIVSFYIVAPIILLLFYIYFHLYLQRHWEYMSDFPAIFPDGKPLNKKTYPWLANGLVCLFFKRLINLRPALARLQSGILLLALFLLVPITIGSFMVKYSFTRQDDIITIILLALVFVSMLIGGLIMDLAIATLKGNKPKGFLRKSIMEAKKITYLGIILIFIFTIGILFRGEISTYRKADLRGANLEWQHLAGADLQGANLIGANLHGANLKDADLRGADLRGANIEGAIINNANFQEANLGEVKGLSREFHEKARNTFLAFYAKDYLSEIYDYGLWGSMDHNEHLFEKDLSKYVFNYANSIGADFGGYNLQNATFDRANLKDAIFENADLRGANLASAKNLSVGNLSDAIIDSTTKLPQYIIDSLKVHNDILFLRKLGLYPYTPSG